MKFLLSLFLFISVSYSQFTFSNVTQLEHDLIQGKYHKIIKIGDATNFLVLYSPSVSFRVKSFSVNPSTYAIAELESYLVYSGINGIADMVVIDSTHAIVAYNEYNGGHDGFLQTISISTDKATIALIDKLQHTDMIGRRPRISQIDATHFLISYQGESSDGWAKVINIDGSYNITVGDSVEFRTGTLNAAYPMSIGEIGDTDIFAITYYDSGIRMASVSVDGGYNLTFHDDIDVLNDGYVSNLVSIDNTHLIIAASNADATGHLKTFSIDGSNQFTRIDSVQFVASGIASTYTLGFLEFDGHYLLDYAPGKIFSIDVDGSYDITVQADLYDHLSGWSSFDGGGMDEVDGTHILVGIENTSTNDGYLQVLETTPSSGWSHTIDGVSSPTKVDGLESWTKINEVE